MSLYIIFNKDFNGKVILKALDENNLEVGRSVVSVNGKTNKASYINFPFDDKTPFTSIKLLKLERI